MNEDVLQKDIDVLTNLLERLLKFYPGKCYTQYILALTPFELLALHHHEPPLMAWHGLQRSIGCLEPQDCVKAPILVETLQVLGQMSSTDCTTVIRMQRLSTLYFEEIH